ncbi:MAG: uroporphyrinogen-III C-methyltransferase [Myxococcota bacterium]
MSRGDGVGRVVLVGAGPGHPGLLTLRGAEVLGQADVVLYDELASPELLALAAPGAECVNVGKRGHDAPTRQQPDINALLVERARAGLQVVRLKGGDPFVFGRGGEEASACVEAGIPFEVVPGVSSALAAPAFAGIPLTDRRHAASFAVVTGHKDPSKAAEATRWAELGRAVDTLVILMGMRNLPDLVARMLEGGKDPGCPAAAVMHGTLPRQRVVEASLAELPAAVEAAGLAAPAAVVIGDVVGLRGTLAWWERMPLFGRSVLVPRAPEQSSDMVGAVRAAGAQPVAIPLIAFGPPEEEDARALARALRDLGRYDAVVFASSNAVRFTVEAARAAGVDLAAPGPRYACVGRRTADALLDCGLPVHSVAGGGRGGGAEALLEVLARAVDPRGRRFLLPRSQLGRDTLATGLREAGAEVDAITAYRTLRPEIDADDLRARIRDGAIDVLTFTSPSTVQHLLEWLDEPARAAARRCTIAAIGATTARALEREGFEVTVVPARPDGAALVEALVRHFAGPER